MPCTIHPKCVILIKRHLSGVSAELPSSPNKTNLMDCRGNPLKKIGTESPTAGNGITAIKNK